MTHKARRRRIIFFSVAILLTASVVSLGVFSKIRQDPKQKKGATALKAESVTTLPAVFSKVKDLEVAGATLLNRGTPQAAVAIDIINNSDQPVISLEIIAGDDNDWSGLGIDGLEDPDKPQVAIPPHSLKTFKWFLGEVLEGYPIVISGAGFANGTEDGDARSLRIMHKVSATERGRPIRGSSNEEDNPPFPPHRGGNFRPFNPNIRDLPRYLGRQPINIWSWFCQGCTGFLVGGTARGMSPSSIGFAF